MADGVALFSVDDPNRYFRVFHGASPQSQFNCVAPGERPPDNGLPTFDNCQVRVATDMLKPTADQVFRRLAFTAVPAAAAGAPPVTAAPATAASDADDSTSAAALALVGVGGAVVVIVIVLALRRRSPRSR